MVVVRPSKCRATHTDVAYLDSDQEEADTKSCYTQQMLPPKGAKSIKISLADTDVFVLGP